MLEKKVGFDFKTKMQWFFEEEGWPLCSLPLLGDRMPRPGADRAALLDALQEVTDQLDQQMLSKGEGEPRPGVLRLMDEAKEAGLKLGVCSAAAKSTAEVSLRGLIGDGRFAGLDVFLAGGCLAEGLKRLPAEGRV